MCPGYSFISTLFKFGFLHDFFLNDIQLFLKKFNCQITAMSNELSGIGFCVLIRLDILNITEMALISLLYFLNNQLFE